VLEVSGGNTEFDREEALEVLSAGEPAAGTLLPSEPPDGARILQVLQVDERGLVMAVEIPFGGRFNRPDVIWVKNEIAISAPFPVDSAQAWLVYPERARAGERLRVFGRELSRELVALRSADDGKIIELKDVGQSKARRALRTRFRSPG
jgi:hypothetical protein